MADELGAVANLFYEMGTLKQSKRTGWWMAGVKDPESVAEHAWRVSLIASVIAQMEGADPGRAALLAVWHDTGETRTGDASHLAQRYAGKADAEKVTADQTAGMPDSLGDLIRGIVGEYETRDSAESVCAADADKLECMLQGIEYREQGYVHAQRWIDNSRKRITTKSAAAIADRLLETDGLAWLRHALGEA